MKYLPLIDPGRSLFLVVWGRIDRWGADGDRKNDPSTPKALTFPPPTPSHTTQHKEHQPFLPTMASSPRARRASSSRRADVELLNSTPADDKKAPGASGSPGGAAARSTAGGGRGPSSPPSGCTGSHGLGPGGRGRWARSSSYSVAPAP